MTTDPVGLGIIGLGRWSQAHAAAAARSSTVTLVNCHARTPEGRAAFRQRHDVSAEAASVEELLGDPRVEAVIVSTPNDLHVEHTAAAIEAGKPVLVDKPVAVDVAEGLTLLRQAGDAGVPVGVAHHARRLAGHRAARDWLDGGDAGRPIMAHADFSNARGGQLTADAWYHSVRGAEAGVLIQVGIHQVDNVLWLLGPAVAVSGHLGSGNARGGATAGTGRGVGLPMTAAVTIRHATGVVSTVTSNWLSPSHYRMDILGTGGNLSYRVDHSRWTSGDVDDAGELILDTGGTRHAYPWTKGDPLRDQLEELGRSAREGTQMTVGVADGLRAVAVVQAAVASSQARGATVDVANLLRDAGATADEIDLLVGGT